MKTTGLAIATFLFLVTTSQAADWRRKVDDWVLDQTAGTRKSEFLVELSVQADLARAHEIPDRTTRGTWVHDRLLATATASQAPLLEMLHAENIRHRSFWVANLVLVEGGAELVERIAARDDVRRLHANPRVALRMPSRRPAARSAGGVEANILQTRAPQVFWANAITGQGIVVANQDTGVDWGHPALISQYRGNGGGPVSHDYHWHDAIHAGGGICGPDTTEPCDDTDHGTSTMGVLVGDDGTGNAIGMAPGATWIACRNMDEGFGTPASYTECFQFFAAPTDLADQNPNPALAPHVVSNSWLCTPEEGCTDPTMLQAVVENVRAAGILIVASAGNDGSTCGSVDSPPALYEASFSVGAVNVFGELSQFSSRGPVLIDGSYRRKPDVVAPGDDIRTAIRGGGYSSFSGTSLSAPHAAGLAALSMSAESCFRGNVTATEHWIASHAQGFSTSEVCGAIPGTESPNNSYGFGIIRAALPDAISCDLPVAGSLDGVDGNGVRCTNVALAQSVTAGVPGNAFDCTAAGLPAAPGQRLQLSFGATAFAGDIGGSVTGMRPKFARCRNLASGQTVSQIVPAGENAWNCTAAGLAVSIGDEVRQTLIGIAK